jgi:hypothetical protein
MSHRDDQLDAEVITDAFSSRGKRAREGRRSDRLTDRSIRSQLVTGSRREDLLCERLYRINRQNRGGYVVTTFAC